MCCREPQTAELQWILSTGSNSAQLQREVLCDQVIVMKHDDDVDFKFYKWQKQDFGHIMGKVALKDSVIQKSCNELKMSSPI